MWSVNMCTVYANSTVATAFKLSNVAVVLWLGQEPEQVDTRLE